MIASPARVFLLLAVVPPCVLANVASSPTAMISVGDLAPPTAAIVGSPILFSHPDGTVWASWLESGPEFRSGNSRGYVAAFDAEHAQWRQARQILPDVDFPAKTLDPPAVAFDGEGRLHAVWTDGRGRAFRSAGDPASGTWQVPEPWDAQLKPKEMFALARLASGRVLALWLDGRGDGAGENAQRLYARLVDDPAAAEHMVDGAVCDCCPPGLTAFLDGGALAGFRDRSSDEVRDIATARLRRGKWAVPESLHADGWRIAGCPVNGPRLASDGSRVAAAWFTAAEDDPRVLVSYSPDAGMRWLAPLRVSDRPASGFTDVVLLRNGTLLVSWVDAGQNAWLTRITSSFSRAQTVSLGVVPPTTAPRLAILEDYEGGRSAARILAVLAERGESGDRFASRRVTLREGDLIAQEQNCDCAPNAHEIRGFPIRGEVIAIHSPSERTTEAPGNAAIRVRHPDVPGVFDAGTREFVVERGLAAKLSPGDQFLGRIERDGSEWRLVNARLLGP